MWTNCFKIFLVLGLVAGGPAFSQNDPLPNEKIVFNSDINGGHDIWMINPDGTGLEILIDRPGTQTFPRISPDGTKVAYYHRPVPGGPRDIVIRDLATGTDTVLVTPFTNSPSTFEWFGDSAAIIARNIGGSCTGDPISFIPIDGSCAISLFAESGRRLTVMAVDPLTDVLYYSSDPCNSPNTEVKAYDITTGHKTLIQSFDGRLEGRGETFLNTFVFQKASSGYSNTRIARMNTDGSGELILSTGSGLKDVNPRLSVDGTRAVFVRQEPSYDTDLYLVDLETLLEIPLFLGPYSAGAPDWGVLRFGAAPACSTP